MSEQSTRAFEVARFGTKNRGHFNVVMVKNCGTHRQGLKIVNHACRGTDALTEGTCLYI